MCSCLTAESSVHFWESKGIRCVEQCHFSLMRIVARLTVGSVPRAELCAVILATLPALRVDLLADTMHSSTVNRFEHRFVRTMSTDWVEDLNINWGGNQPSRSPNSE